MELFETVQSIRAKVLAARQERQRIGLVPTMGYLHEGHLALMRQARSECELVVVSIFVNPTQFGPNEDLGRYPRNLEWDMELCRTVPVNAIFHPNVEEVYPSPFLTSVRVVGLTDTLCGASRPGHFEGVATVVVKLLNMIQPDTAYFGQKDAQQVAVIRKVVNDLNMDTIAIQTVPTVREPNGLALSSRNVYLSPEERRAAPVLYRSLQMAQEQVAAGERNMKRLRQAVEAMIVAEPLATVDYVQIVDQQTLHPVEDLNRSALAALAVRFGSTRLIDNCTLNAAGHA